MQIKNLLHRYKHAWIALYALIYMPWFIWLEKTVTKDYYVIHSSLDDYIPFVEYFIVPYLLWFLFIGVTLIYFFLCDTQGFYKLAMFLFTGMTIFLIISTIWPNGLDLRPDTFVRDNVFVDLVKQVYRTDTPTNVLPSIHVFNSIGACVAIMHSETLYKIKWVRYGSFILSTLIILATMFLKQHSVIDVIAAFVLGTLMYIVVYAREPKTSSELSHQPIY
ncbi:phosphatase PAP2 family protein [Lachnospiraceae bacterium OttesenSCG-928-E19]|nr:phosphatase PAP2 family protein [Lachnospiraceae bacterium OttesenSCG-928-E19]